MNSMMFRYAQGIILGWAEVLLLVKQPDCAVLVLDTASLHAGTAVGFTLGEGLCSPKL
jgi:aspartate/glutamate racemase